MPSARELDPRGGQARGQLLRRADRDQIAAPRGLHRLDRLLVRHQRLERKRLFPGDPHHHQAERVGHREAHRLQYGRGLGLGALVDAGANDGIGRHDRSPWATM